jgi:putative sterol carrier protein
MPARPTSSRRRPGARATFRRRSHAALRRLIARADDPQLERTLGKDLVLRRLFGAMESAYVPGAAEGVSGEVAFVLRAADGSERVWTLAFDPERARSRRGRSAAPTLVVHARLADALRMAAGQLDPGAALLSGALDLDGDFALVTRLGAMLGRPGAL